MHNRIYKEKQKKEGALYRLCKYEAVRQRTYYDLLIMLGNSSERICELTHYPITYVIHHAFDLFLYVFFCYATITNLYY